MEDFVYVDGKKYRRGYTTGSCATATCICALGLLSGDECEAVKINTPKGIVITIPIEESRQEGDPCNGGYVECAVKKDGGDDIDATHEMMIFCRAELVNRDEKREGVFSSADGRILLTGGEGIGLVTRKGLNVDVGMPAINETPRSMIFKSSDEYLRENPSLSEYMDKNEKAVLFTVFAPEGERIAQKTFNTKLGIVGGISIIGTTGIVEPMSDEGWKKSLSLELSMLKEAGEDSVILTPGNIGVKNLTSRGAREKNVVKISNFVGYMLTEAVRLGFKRIVLAGHIGKLIKVAGGIFNTHSRIADARTDILISNLALMGAKREDLIKIASCLSSEEAARMVIDMSYGDVYKIIADKCRRNSLDYPRVDGEFELEVALYMLDGRLLGETDGMKDMLEKIGKSDKENEGGTDD